MAVCEADIFQVVVFAPGADAFLAGGSAFVIALLETEENVLELVHARVGEKQGGIVVRYERGAAHHAMAALFEEFQKCFADFVASPVSASQICPRLKQIIIADEFRSRNAWR